VRKLGHELVVKFVPTPESNGVGKLSLFGVPLSVGMLVGDRLVLVEDELAVVVLEGSIVDDDVEESIVVVPSSWRLRSSATFGGGRVSTRIRPSRSRLASAELMAASMVISLAVIVAATGRQQLHNASTSMSVEKYNGDNRTLRKRCIRGRGVEGEGDEFASRCSCCRRRRPGRGLSSWPCTAGRTKRGICDFECLIWRSTPHGSGISASRHPGEGPAATAAVAAGVAQGRPEGCWPVAFMSAKFLLARA